MSGGIEWACSHCGAALHLAGTLWRTDSGDPFCGTFQHPSGDTSTMHAPRSNWVHPAMR